MKEVIPHERIESHIFELRGKKVMLDRDLADLYGVVTKALNQAVSRTIGRFPDDFSFKLTWAETRFLRSQIVTLEKGAYSKYPSRAFTEHGILMLSSVLRSEKAVNVNIQIMRTFVKLREMIHNYSELSERIQKIEKRADAESREIWKAIRLLQSTVIK